MSQSTGSRVLGFRELQPTGSVVAAPRLERTGSVVVGDGASLLQDVCDLPGPGSEPATPVPSGGFFTRHPPPPGKPSAHAVASARTESEFPVAANEGAGSYTRQASETLPEQFRLRHLQAGCAFRAVEPRNPPDGPASQNLLITSPRTVVALPGFRSCLLFACISLFK